MSQLSVQDIFRNGGEMGALISKKDWSTTPLGPVDTWPQSLQTTVNICLFSRFPILIWWGPEFLMIYNDAYRPMLGTTKHPASMGQRGQECWAEIWHIIGPMLKSVYYDGKATWSYDQMLPLNRNGFVEECYFTFSYSPIFDENGAVGGVFTAVTETTERVLSERRLQTLRALGEGVSKGTSAEEACRLSVNILAQNPTDIPFSLIYLLDDTQRQAYLIGSSGVKTGTAGILHTLELDHDSLSWPLSRVAASGGPFLVEDIANDFAVGPWPEIPHAALLLPIFARGQNQIRGFLVAGVSARLQLDDDYRGFFDLIAGQLANAVAHAQSYEEERQRVDALAELDRAKTEFFSNISHEFRTPLTLMINPLVDALSDSRGQLTPEQSMSLKIAHRNSLRLLKLVNTLLDFSRIQSNRVQAWFVPTDLAKVTVDLASNFRSAMNAAGLQFEVDCPSLPEPVYVDRDMWEKMVLNLLSNAFKFTFVGKITVLLRMDDSDVILEVRDTGTGIPEHELPFIFQRFHRVQGAKGRTFEGSGIGLALVQELVRFHGGHVDVSSEVGLGSTFKIMIPRGSGHLPPQQIGDAAAEAPSASIAAPFVEEALRWLPSSEPIFDQTSGEDYPLRSELAGAHILVVEDNADMRDYLYHLFGPHYTIQTANDGQEALALIQQSRPDLVLSDVMLPNLDGFALLRRLRSDSLTSTLPVILLSARAGEEARIEGFQAGADDYLVKPFSARELLVRVEAHLQIARLRHELVNQQKQARTEIEQILESIDDAFYALDRDWCFTYINQKAEQFLEKTRGELIGRNIWEVYPEQVGGYLYQKMHRALTDQCHIQFETAREMDQWIEINVYPGPNGISLYVHDITARKQAEAAEREHRLLAEALRDVTLTINSTLDLDDVLDRILLDVGLVVPHDASAILLLDGDAAVVHRIRGFESDPGAIRELEKTRFLMHKTSTLRAMIESGEALVIPDIDDYPGWVRLRFERRIPLHAYLGMPIFLQEDLIGFLNLFSLTPAFFQQMHVDRLRLFAEAVAIAIRNARQYQQAQELAAFEERQRLARDLHDAVSQTLFSSMTIAQAVPRLWARDPARALSEIDRLVRLNRAAAAEMRSLLLELRPDSLLNTDLSILLNHLIDATSGRKNIKGQLVVEGQPELLPPNVHMAFYRIAQESLNNIIKHSRATRFTIDLKREPHHLLLRITDNGQGFDPGTLSPGLGLDNMRERAETIGAHLDIDSRPGEGTQILLAWYAVPERRLES